ncbi:MAG: DUF2520 domain-containing protein [Candidatus Kapabacteria bacterium]|nr:DUF2520 domain-containing protein [Candidatus Kapabacteria bacterium]MDW8012497.1 DUF2520 domain-containing protein [Bacteroidota bacterium]
MNELPTCGIVGPGRLGTTLALAFHRLGCLRWLKGRSPQHAVWAQAQGIPYREGWDDLPPVDLVWYTVPDQAITAVVEESIQALGTERLQQTALIHTAGSFGGEVFKGAPSGVEWGCAHPFQTFPWPPQPYLLRCVGWLVESPYPRVRQQLTLLIRVLEGIPVVVSCFPAEHRTRYHIAAVAASNVLTALLHFAFDIASSAGIPASVFLRPIAEASVRNTFSAIGSFPLTGPIIRADWPTLQRHLECLQGNERAVYRSLLLATASVAHSRGLLSEEQWNYLQQLLPPESV